MRKLKKWLSEYPILWIISIMVGLIIIISLFSSRFFTVANFSNLMKQVSIIAILGAGQTVVILSGGIDLSVGAVLALGAVLMGGLINIGIDPVIAALIGVALSTLCGALNGIIIGIGKIPPFIATLGMMGIARGLALVYTKGVSVMVLNPLFMYFGSGKLLGLPVPIIIVFLVYIVIYILLTQTILGRNIYAIGDNEEASNLAGINITKHKVIIYTISGFLAGVAALIMVGRLCSAPPHVAGGAELNAIAAVIIGGTSFLGGIGNVESTFFGAMIMSILTNGLNLLGVSSFWQQTFIGMIIIIAVWIDKLRIKK